MCAFFWQDFLEGDLCYLRVVISDGRSVLFSIGGPLCGFLRTALYPAQVPGGTKLYLLPSVWVPLRLLFFFVCYILLRTADFQTSLPSVTLLINQVFNLPL